MNYAIYKVMVSLKENIDKRLCFKFKKRIRDLFETLIYPKINRPHQNINIIFQRS